MKRILGLLLSGLLSVCLLSCSNSAAVHKEALSPNQQLVAHEGYSTVALVYYDYDNNDDKVSDYKLLCSAVWVDDTHILTALHCAKAVQKDLQAQQDAKEKEQNSKECGLLEELFGGGCDRVLAHKVIELKNLPMHFVQWNEANAPGVEANAWHLSQLVGWSESYDLALLEATGGSRAIPVHQVAKLAKETPGLTEPVRVVGHPKGLYWTFLEGTVAGYPVSLPHVEELGPFTQLQMPLYYGNSGGGAFNSKGELIGIADFLYRVPGEGFFVYLDNIRYFLTQQNVLTGKDAAKLPEPVKDDKKSSDDKKADKK